MESVELGTGFEISDDTKAAGTNFESKVNKKKKIKSVKLFAIFIV